MEQTEDKRSVGGRISSGKEVEQEDDEKIVKSQDFVTGIFHSFHSLSLFLSSSLLLLQNKTEE